ncbi:hypothetical protein BDV33DRAFT_195617 [Aspergillus novoparasiticus]|uniref:Geranylgeranyl pyrophosphate synthetase n=1 Tax=Aspergillus novoparasiticus TaxID=986946 RepID=A0A5N6EBN6_9EURO|nr:hypothetical protein BDV33DRAFT_195617 [Aspergillus novoparasiticus]
MKVRNKLADEDVVAMNRYQMPSSNSHLHHRQEPYATVPEPAAPKLGSMLATISRAGLDSLANSSVKKDDPRITECTVVGSYNWLNRKNSTIVIPGKPPAWTPTAAPENLPEDNGEYFRDPNAARYPSYPLQPAVEAILRMNDTFESNNVDIVACGSTMGNLLRYVRNIDKGFRIIIEAVGSTVFFVCRENSPTETIPGVRGYGHTFPEASTTWEEGVKGSESHQRMVQYNFAGLRCVVRFEADGYFPTSPISQAGYALNEVQNRADLLSALFEESTVTSHAPEDKEHLVIQTGGQSVSQSSIFNLKTRSFRRKDDNILGEELPRMWVSQISNFILAFHEDGLFNDVRVQDVREEVKIWEKEQENSLRQFAALLKVLTAFAQGRADGRFEVVHDEESKILQFRELDRNVNRALPESLKERWSSGSTAAVVLGGISSDDWSEKDFTACLASTCGYCGHCTY